MQSRTPAVPKTLSEFNRLLENAGLPGLAPDQFQEIKRRLPRDQLLQAAARMNHDQGARMFLLKAVSEVAGIGQLETRRSPEPVPDPGRDSVYPLENAPSAHEERRNPYPVHERISMHVYGGKAALSFEADMTRTGEHTVSLDAAAATAPRQFDWKNKIRIQLTRIELPVVAGVFLGAIPRCEYSNHGPESNKGFSIEDQGEKLFVRVFASGQSVRAVPVEPSDAYRVTTLLLRQLHANAPWMSPGDIAQTVRQVIGRRMAR